MGTFSLRGLLSRRDQPRDRRRRPRIRPVDTTILLVDDSRTTLFALRRMLEQGGYRVIEARDGESGFDLAMSTSPDLALVDIVMPGMNGYQLTRRVRREKRDEPLPIILMSGSDQASDRFWGQRLGAEDFLAKPIPRGNLFHSIERVLYPDRVAAGSEGRPAPA